MTMPAFSVWQLPRAVQVWMVRPRPLGSASALPISLVQTPLLSRQAARIKATFILSLSSATVIPSARKLSGFYTVERWSIINKVHSRYQTQWRMYNLFLNAPYHRIDRLKVASHCLNKVMSVIETNDRVFIKQLISTRYAIT